MGIQQMYCCMVKVGCRQGMVGYGMGMVGWIRMRLRHMVMELVQIPHNQFFAAGFLVSQFFASREQYQASYQGMCHTHLWEEKCW